jgi:hypothetical protein
MGDGGAALRAERALNDRAELLDRERLLKVLERAFEEELAARWNEVERDDRQVRRVGARGASVLEAHLRLGLEEHQVCLGRNRDFGIEHERLVAHAPDEDGEQPPDIGIRFADQYARHLHGQTLYGRRRNLVGRAYESGLTSTSGRKFSGLSGEWLGVRGKDAGSPDSPTIGATEDAATGGETPPGSCRTCGRVY